jgi:uncharacterized protein (TIGR04222 family)
MTPCIRLAILAFFGLASVAAPISRASADDPPVGAPAAGRDSTRSVYDLAGILSPQQITDLEDRAGAIRRLEHPVVVYIHKKDASFEETVADGRRLMDAWDVQSGPEARDGIVLLLNLKPRDPRHGTYAVVVGKSLIQGSIPQYELDRITADMRPLLKEGRLAESVAGALGRMEQDLRGGPPPPPPPNPMVLWARKAANGPASPVVVFSILAAAAGIGFARRLSPPGRPRSESASSTPNPPSELQPALAGALVSGYVDDADIAATILDLARRGALAIEPEGRKKARIHLLDPSRVHPGYERKLWEILAAQADGGFVSSRAMGRVRAGWSDVLQAIRKDLVERGWFDPEARSRRMPLLGITVVLSTLCAIAMVIAALARSPLAGIGVLVLAIASAIPAIAMARIPNTTERGDREAVPWRGYRSHIQSTGKDPKLDLDLETAVPYALGFGIGESLNKRLQAASRSGVMPAWLGPSGDGAWDGGFYPVWVSFNSSVAPTSSGASSSGASAGSGASGGSF